MQREINGNRCFLELSNLFQLNLLLFLGNQVKANDSVYVGTIQKSYTTPGQPCLTVLYVFVCHLLEDPLQSHLLTYGPHTGAAQWAAVVFSYCVLHVSQAVCIYTHTHSQKLVFNRCWGSRHQVAVHPCVYWRDILEVIYSFVNLNHNYSLNMKGGDGNESSQTTIMGKLIFYFLFFCFKIILGLYWFLKVCVNNTEIYILTLLCRFRLLRLQIQWNKILNKKYIKY